MRSQELSPQKSWRQVVGGASAGIRPQDRAPKADPTWPQHGITRCSRLDAISRNRSFLRRILLNQRHSDHPAAIVTDILEYSGIWRRAHPSFQPSLRRPSAGCVRGGKSRDPGSSQRSVIIRAIHPVPRAPMRRESPPTGERAARLRAALEHVAGPMERDPNTTSMAIHARPLPRPAKPGLRMRKRPCYRRIRCARGEFARPRTRSCRSRHRGSRSHGGASRKTRDENPSRYHPRLTCGPRRSAGL